MQDTIIKETGNSRFLRSSVAEDITFAGFIALLRAGQLPIDLAGINEEGIDVLGMSLKKETLLNDETEVTIWGDTNDRAPTDALKAIFEILSTKLDNKIVTGTYTGNGATTRTISLGFTPQAVLLFFGNGCTYDSNGTSKVCYGGLALPGRNVAIDKGPDVDRTNPYSNWVDGSTAVAIVDGGFKVANASSSTYKVASNITPNTATFGYYTYIAIT